MKGVISMKKYDFSYHDNSYPATQDQIDIGLTCKECAENHGEKEDGKIVCELDGYKRPENFTCPQWK